MKKRIWICVFFLSFVISTYATGAEAKNYTIVLKAGFNGDSQKEVKTIALRPSVAKLKDLIDTDPIVRMYFTQMIDQVPLYYQTIPEPYICLTSINEMLYYINEALSNAPEYNDTPLVGFPINSILNWTQGVPAGFAAFRNEKVNEIFKEILDDYGVYLNTKDSREVLKKGGSWQSKKALETLGMEKYIKYNPDDTYMGFDSWNDFFIRKIKPEKRPIAEPENDNVIVSACDSEVYDIQSRVKKRDWFWIKSQPYSLMDMLGNDEAVVDQFVGGDVYQAFLSAMKYHRWHSPVTGTIKKAYIKQGTYYSGIESQGVDPASPDQSQGYIAHVATRAIILIEADNPKIGLMGVMPIGMAEVSSCVLDEKIKPGYKIKKGEELGYFQFGGSTHCLIFRPGVINHENSEDNNDNGFLVNKGDDIKMGQAIAIIQ